MSLRIGVVLPEINESTLRLAAQVGATDIVGNVPAGPGTHPLHGTGEPVADFAALLHTQQQIADAGLTWAVVESLMIPDRVKFGQAGRDEDIENWCRSIRNIGAAGIPIVCYHWMTVYGHFRTSHTRRVRGGALSTAYNHDLMRHAPYTEHGEVSQETLWASLEYFLRAVVPVAEEAGVKLAMHPDDPPLSPIRGLGRIMISPDNFQRLIDLVPSPSNGITFCQGCFSEMGCDIPAVLKHFGEQDKVFFAHFRNLRGTTTDFYETFHDTGQVDMVAVMRAFYDLGFQYPIRPDHVPALEGEDRDSPGYSLLGRLYAIGFMKGLMLAVEKDLETIP